MRRLNSIFMGTPPLAATVLKVLCERGFRPSLVVTQSAKATGRGQKVQPSAVAAYATAQNIPLLETDDVNTDECVGRLQRENPDVLLVVAFGQILKDAVLKMPKLYCLNVHGSLLPKYRGAAPIQRAIWDGEKETGVTIQKMAKKLDTGDILLQKKTPITSKETSATLFDKLAVLGAEALVDSLRLISEGKETFTPQNEAEATYAKKLEKQHSPIDWNKTAEEIVNQVRALNPWPVAETTLGGTRLKIFGAQVDAETNLKPGELKSDAFSFIQVGSAKGSVFLTEIQLENRKRLPVPEFLKAYRGQFPFSKVGE